MLAVTATLKRGSTRAGPAANHSSQNPTLQHRIGSNMMTRTARKQSRRPRLQHQAPMRVGMDTMSMSMETMRDRFCALASPSTPAAAPGVERSGASGAPGRCVTHTITIKCLGSAPRSSPGGGPHVAQSSSSSAGGGGIETLTEPGVCELFLGI